MMILRIVIASTAVVVFAAAVAAVVSCIQMTKDW